jgi:hypothetical protein
MPEQLTLDGGSVPQGTIKDRVISILRKHPDARNSYAACVFHYWCEVDGLRDVLGKCADTCDWPTGEHVRVDTEPFRKWLVSKATSWKTIQNRAMECQREHPELDACDDVRAWRDEQAVAGPVGS